MLRRILPPVLLLITLASVIYIAVSGSDNPVLILATVMIGVLGVIEPLMSLYDRFVPDPKLRQVQPRESGTIQAYLNGQLEEFKKEQKLFVPLSADSVIQTQFADKARHQVYDSIKQVETDRFVLVGDPGAGKSTTLRHLWTEAARQHLREQTTKVPLLIRLGTSDNPEDVDALLDEWWKKPNLPETVQAYLNRSQLVLYLDGLNEMPLDSRKQRAAALKAWLEKHPETPVVITCRVRDYEDDGDLKLGEDLQVVRVLPLDEGRMEEFIQKREADGLWEKIVGDDALRRMAANPYNLSMLIEIYKARTGELPKDLNELYSLYVETTHKRYEREGKVRLKWEHLKPALERLAFRMIIQDKGTAADVVWAQQQAGRKALRDGFALGVLLREGEKVRFYHQSLQGYFALRQLSQRLRAKNRWERITKNPTALIRQIGDLGEAASPAVPALIPLLNDQDKWVRSAAAKALGSIGEAANSVVPALIPLLNDQYKPVRWAAAWALGQIGEAASPAVPLLIPLLNDQDEGVRWAAAWALGQIGEAASPAVPLLIPLLNDQDEKVRWAAAWTLGQIGEAASPAMPLLIPLLNDQDEGVRWAAADALGGIGEAASPAVPLLIPLLNDQDEGVRWAAADALGEIGEAASPAMPFLIPLLNDQDEEMRWRAAWALRGIGEEASPAVPFLIPLLNDQDERMWRAAAVALERIGTPEALAAVETWQKQNNR